MCHKKHVITGICILLLINSWEIGTVRATEAVPETVFSENPETEFVEEEEQVEESEELRKKESILCAELWEEAGYMTVSMGSCYPGSRVEYDLRRKRSILYPAGWQKQIVVREKQQAELYYGKYRGKVEYEEYETISPILDADFFLNPIRALELTTEDVDQAGLERSVNVEEEQQLELFYAPLVYEGILNDEEVYVTAVTVVFDEGYMPKEVRFTLESDVLDVVQLASMEEELTQRYSYMDLKTFTEHLEFVKEIMKEIVPEEEITIADYVTDLNNILQVEDEYFLQRLTHQGEELSYYSGWDKRAVLAYLEAVNTKFNMFAGNGYEAGNVTKTEYIEVLENTYSSARQIGSDV